MQVNIYDQLWQKVLVNLENTLDEVINIAKQKSAKRGAFDQKIFLEKVIEKES